ncbi:hypothetical protein SDC9_173561 [bioreactor metagenome]|uniref:Uncharacterized protein n=1 Tax=bioreactor metagenome TaxID=1076179 RepID=A0A645GGS2_9ZZZZ
MPVIYLHLIPVNINRLPNMFKGILTYFARYFPEVFNIITYGHANNSFAKFVKLIGQI